MNNGIQSFRVGASLALAGLATSAVVGLGCAIDGSKEGKEEVGITQAELTAPTYAFANVDGIGLPNNVAQAIPSYESSGIATVTRSAAGSYMVAFSNVPASANGGDVQVSTMSIGNSPGDERCNVTGWGGSPTLDVWVNCSYGGLGFDSEFTVSYVSRSDTPGVEGGYVWACQPSATSYSPLTSCGYAWNSTGQGITIAKNSGNAGSYTVSFAGQSITGGTVEVTSYGSLGGGYCEIGGWSNQSVNVLCFSKYGAPTDTVFTLIFSEGLGNNSSGIAVGSPNGTSSFSYAWADQPSSPSYTPNSFYQLGEISVPGCCVDTTTPLTTITRQGLGAYTVNFPQIPASTGGFFDKSTLKVTAYGSSGEYCNVYSWTGNSSSTQAQILCFNSNLQATDSYFAINLSSTHYVIY